MMPSHLLQKEISESIHPNLYRYPSIGLMPSASCIMEENQPEQKLDAENPYLL
jgi:hypothetical protein